MPQHTPYVVVPDVNVYLTAARELGRGFTIDDFQNRLKEAKSRRNESDVFCTFATLLEPFPDGSPIEICSGTHILETVAYKAKQPKGQGSAEDSGLGWSFDEAQPIIEMIYSLVKTTGGVIMPRNGAYLNPPLDYEDGSVMKCLADVHPESAICQRICLTYDRKMIQALEPRKPDIIPPMTLMTPEQWCSKIRAERFRVLTRSMKR